MPKQIDLFSEPKKKEPVFVKKPEQFVSIDESIFAPKKLVVHKPVVIKEEINHNKSEDKVDINESIFAPNKITLKSDDSWRQYIEEDERVDIEETIFASPKKGITKSKSVVSKMSDKEIENRYNTLFNTYKRLYVRNSRIFYERKNIVTPDVFDRCCILLNKSMHTTIENDIILKSLVCMVKDVCLSPSDVLYRYSDSQSVLIRFIGEAIPEIDWDNLLLLVDRAYAEAFVERGGIWLK